MWKKDDWLYAMTRDASGSMMWMDPLHVKMIYHHIMANDYSSITEIGCHDGFSTSAIVQALIDGKSFNATCVDQSIRPLLLTTLLLAPSVSKFEGNSIDYLAGKCAELLIIDGDHSLNHVMAEWERIKQRPVVKTIVAHDCGYDGGCPGPIWLRSFLEGTIGYRVVVDEKARKGMATHRGLMFATCDEKVSLPDVK